MLKGPGAITAIKAACAHVETGVGTTSKSLCRFCTKHRHRLTPTRSHQTVQITICRSKISKFSSTIRYDYRNDVSIFRHVKASLPWQWQRCVRSVRKPCNWVNDLVSVDAIILHRQQQVSCRKDGRSEVTEQRSKVCPQWTKLHQHSREKKRSTRALLDSVEFGETREQEEEEDEEKEEEAFDLWSRSRRWRGTSYGRRSLSAVSVSVVRRGCVTRRWLDSSLNYDGLVLRPQWSSAGRRQCIDGWIICLCLRRVHTYDETATWVRRTSSYDSHTSK